MRPEITSFRALKITAIGRAVRGARTSAVVALILVLAWPTYPAARGIEVDLQLVLAVDVSGSMDAREHAA